MKDGVIKGHVVFDNGQVVPYLGEVNTMPRDEWNKLCEQQAIKNYRYDTGREPESGKQALEYMRQKYADAPQSPKHEIPVVRCRKIEIVPTS